jgi:uncharacterized protein (TIGR03435 family)
MEGLRVSGTFRAAGGNTEDAHAGPKGGKKSSYGIPGVCVRQKKELTMRAFATGGAILILAVTALAQDTSKRLEFEAASVRPAPQPTGGRIRIGPPGGPGTADPTRYNFNFVTIRNLLMNAYNVKSYQIVGPSWLDMERYELTATMAPGTTKDQGAVMLQNLLADRFGLKLHKETKELPLYELVVGKNGPKLKAHVDDPNAPKLLEPGAGPLPLGKNGVPVVPPGANLMMISNGKLHIMSNKATTGHLADTLSDNLRTPVVDKTGLTGEYDIDLEFSADGLAGIPPPPPGAGPGGLGPGPGPGPAPGAGGDAGDPISLTAAVQEQLGLRMDQKKGPVEILVIDHAEKVPSEN